MLEQKISLGSFVLLIIAFLLYSTTGVFSKMTSAEVFLSLEYFILLSLIIVAMGVYAILWQIVLKRVPLSQAFLFKSMTVIFSLAFAYTIFDETISWKNIVGAIFIIMGIIINSRYSKMT